jgi:ATP sulfurylase
MKHASDPIYLNFLNIIRCRQPTQIKFDNVLLDCMISKDEILSNIKATTTILCIHQINVDNYNNLILEKLFSSNEIFDFPLDTNVSEFEHMQQWIKDSHFDHIKKIAAGALVLITEIYRYVKRRSKWSIHNNYIYKIQ